MTAHTTDVYSGDLRSDGADEIDLRRYIIALFRWWREIVTIALVAGVITGAVAFWLQQQEEPMYAASADILIARLLSQIELDPRVQTTLGSNQNDGNGWRTSLLQLANSGVVAQAVFAELQGEVPEDIRQAENLLNLIEAEVPLSADGRVPSNLIRITATTTDPEFSAELANRWVVHLADYVNALYGDVPESTIESVAAELDSSLAAYQQAQVQYEEFIADSQSDRLERQIQEKSILRNEIMANYTRMLTAVVSSEYNTRVNIYTTLTTTPILHAMAVIDSQSNGTLRTFRSLYDTRAKVLSHLTQARTMQESLQVGGEAAAKTNVTALQLLKVGVFTVVMGSGNVDSAYVNTPLPQLSMTLDEQLADVAALVGVLEDYAAEVDAEIVQLAESGIVGSEFSEIADLAPLLDLADENGLSETTEKMAEAYTQLMGPNGLLGQPPVDIGSSVSVAHEEVLTTLEREIRALRAEISAEEARQRELLHRRDVAWRTYDTVSAKLEELNLLRSSANSEVRIGNPALVPSKPVPGTELLMPVVAVTAVGFFLAVVIAILAEMFGVRPFFARRTA